MRNHPQFRAYCALVAVYFFWGTTYLGIRMALEMFPPAVLLSLRFLISGLIMLIGARIMGVELPKGRDLRLTTLFGILVLGGGTGALVFAEQWVPSGLAALFITTSPFWMVGLEALLPGGEPLHLPSLAGIGVGFLGVLVLVGPSALGMTAQPHLLEGFLVLQFGCFCWCFGSLLQRRHATRTHPFVNGAIQQVATGAAFLPVAFLFPHHPLEWHTRSVWALAYLVVFGSIVGYSAYVYAMQHLPVPILSTYTYVNPIVAVFLGWLFYRERFGLREAIAMGAVFSGVALVKYWSVKTSEPNRSARAA